MFCKGNFASEALLLDHKKSVHYAHEGEFELHKGSHQHKDGTFNSGTYLKVYSAEDQIITVSEVFTPELVKKLNHLIDRLASKSGVVSIKPSLNCMVATVDGQEGFSNHRHDEIYSNQGKHHDKILSDNCHFPNLRNIYFQLSNFSQMDLITQK